MINSKHGHPPCRSTGKQSTSLFVSIQKEILQISIELKAVVPVVKHDTPEDEEVLRCFMFIEEKFLDSGELEKVKARLVPNQCCYNLNHMMDIGYHFRLLT